MPCCNVPNAWRFAPPDHKNSKRGVSTPRLSMHIMEGGTARPGSTREPSPGRRVLLLIAAFWYATAWAEAVSRRLAPVAVKTGHQLLCSRRHRLVFELVLVQDGVVVPRRATARRSQILAVFCAAPAVARTSLAARPLAPPIATLRTARAAATGSAALSRG